MADEAGNQRRYKKIVPWAAGIAIGLGIAGGIAYNSILIQDRMRIADDTISALKDELKKLRPEGTGSYTLAVNSEGNGYTLTVTNKAPQTENLGLSDGEIERLVEKARTTRKPEPGLEPYKSDIFPWNWLGNKP